MLKYTCYLYMILSNIEASNWYWKIYFSITLLLSSCNYPGMFVCILLNATSTIFRPWSQPCCSTPPKIDFSCNAPTLSLLQPRHSTSSLRAVGLVWLLITAPNGPSVYPGVISDFSGAWYDLPITSSDTNYCRFRVEQTAITLREKAN